LSRTRLLRLRRRIDAHPAQPVGFIISLGCDWFTNASKCYHAVEVAGPCEPIVVALAGSQSFDADSLRSRSPVAPNCTNALADRPSTSGWCK
jgi:hypothetical protein